MKKGLIISIMCLSLTTINAGASQAQMNETLVKMVNQLEAVKPLINQAKQEQSANPRIKIHFDSWMSVDGKTHQGLRQDIEAIQASLISAIDRKNSDPKVYQPIKGDFVGKDHV